MTKRRQVSLRRAKADIAEAFDNWHAWSGGAGNWDDQDEHAAIVKNAEARVKLFLADVERERRLLAEALAAIRMAAFEMNEMIGDRDSTADEPVWEQHQALDALRDVLARTGDTP